MKSAKEIKLLFPDISFYRSNVIPGDICGFATKDGKREFVCVGHIEDPNWKAFNQELEIFDDSPTTVVSYPERVKEYRDKGKL